MFKKLWSSLVVADRKWGHYFREDVIHIWRQTTVWCMERDRHLVLYLNSWLVWLLAPHWCVLPSYFISSHWWDQLACDVGRYMLTGRQTVLCVSGTMMTWTPRSIETKMHVIPMRTYTKIGLKIKRREPFKLYAIPMKAYIDILRIWTMWRIWKPFRGKTYRAWK